MKRLSHWIDALTERQARRTAHHQGRRSALTRLGQWMVGGAVVPTLPWDRSQAFAATPAAKPAPDTSCEYWRNCAIDGLLCTCCGGSISQCPPGTEMSKVTWVGTCRNPKDNIDYLISYYDCCGKPSCGRCLCNNNERERPGYSMGIHNDVNWCMANASSAYHCTVSAIVGVAKS